MFVGTASSHYSAVAGALRVIRGRATLQTARLDHPPSSVAHRPPSLPPLYVDETRLAAGAYSVGLLHSANVARGQPGSERWRSAARRLEESGPPAVWMHDGMAHASPASHHAASGESAAACRISIEHGVRWRHSPLPAPTVSRRSFDCAKGRLLGPTCPALGLQIALPGTNRTI